MRPEKQLGFALAAIAGIRRTGTVGYVLIEGWTVLDSA